MSILDLLLTITLFAVDTIAPKPRSGVTNFALRYLRIHNPGSGIRTLGLRLAFPANQTGVLRCYTIPGTPHYSKANKAGLDESFPARICG
jgi:hypothetical protein